MRAEFFFFFLREKCVLNSRSFPPFSSLLVGLDMAKLLRRSPSDISLQLQGRLTQVEKQTTVAEESGTKKTYEIVRSQHQSEAFFLCMFLRLHLLARVITGDPIGKR